MSLTVVDPSPPAETIRRETILITHATPQDNLIARWLATRLMAAGYKVWVDVRSLKGGDDFWNVIEDQLRHHTIKQIVLISEHVRKPGVLRELALGAYMSSKLMDPDFMIPIRIAPVPHGEFPPEIFRLNSMDAFPNWAAVLPPLLKTLIEAKVPKSEGLEARLLTEIVQAQEAGRLIIEQQPETLLTNWFQVAPERPTLRMFAARGTNSQFQSWVKSINVPTVQHSGLLGSFCDPASLESAGAPPPKLTPRFWMSFDDLVSGHDINPFPSRGEGRRYLVDLMRQHWDLTMARRGLVRFNFASGQVGWFFPDGLIEGAVKVQLPDGRRINRVLSGKFKERRWHLCLVAQPRLWPTPLYRIHANVALSLDGRNPLPGEQTQKVRTRLTRSWWNNKWRDLLLAGMSWLAEGQDTLSLAAGDERFAIQSQPMAVGFPVSYRAEESRSAEENDTGEVELSEDLDDGQDDVAAEDDSGDMP